MKKIMNVVVSAVVFTFSCLCCNAAEVDSAAAKVEEAEEVLYDTLADFTRARSGVRGVKKHNIAQTADRTVARLAYKYAELSNVYELCDAVGVKYYEHENVREYGRLLTAYMLMNVESANDLSNVDIKKMFGILKGPSAELAARRAGRTMFLEAASIHEGIKTIRDELVVAYGGEAGLQKRLDDIVRLQHAFVDFVLED